MLLAIPSDLSVSSPATDLSLRMPRWAKCNNTLDMFQCLVDTECSHWWYDVTEYSLSLLKVSHTFRVITQKIAKKVFPSALHGLLVVPNAKQN